MRPTSSTNFATAPSSRTSTARPINCDSRPVAARLSSANSFSLLYGTTTFAASSRNASDTARPNPPVPPATTATLPAKLISMNPPQPLFLKISSPAIHRFLANYCDDPISVGCKEVRLHTCHPVCALHAPALRAGTEAQRHYLRGRWSPARLRHCRRHADVPQASHRRRRLPQQPLRFPDLHDGQRLRDRHRPCARRHRLLLQHHLSRHVARPAKCAGR